MFTLVIPSIHEPYPDDNSDSSSSEMDAEPWNILPPYKSRVPSCLDSAHRPLNALTCSSLPGTPCCNEDSSTPHHAQEHGTPSCAVSGWTD